MKIYLVIAACSLFSFSQAQNKKFQFKMGAEYGLPKKAEDLSFFGSEANGIVNLSLKKDELYFTKFNPKTLGQTAERVIPLREATRNMNSEMLVDFNPNYFWLRSDWDKGREKEILYATAVDVKNGKLGETDQAVVETKRLAGAIQQTSWLYTFKVVSKYSFSYDADRSKLLVSYRLAPETKNDKKSFDKIGLHVFDNNMNKLWSNEFTMPYSEAMMDNSDFSVDAHGNAYLLAKVYDSDSRRERDKSTGNPAYHLEVFKFTKENQQVVHATIAVDQYFIRESSLIENANHELVIACTYSKNAKERGTEGVFLGLLNNDAKVVNYKKGFYKFPLAEIEKFESARTKRKMERNEDYEMPNLRVTDVLVEKDGSVIIACEEYYTKVHYTGGTNGRLSSTSTYTTYHYDDIITARIDVSGNFQWLRKIPKRQYGTRGMGTMSFKLISDETGYYFLYLDNIKNKNLPEDETPAKHVDGAGGQVFVTKVDNGGNVSKELVFDTREEDVMIFPSQFTKINNKQFIGRAQLKKTLFQPLLITVN